VLPKGVTVVEKVTSRVKIVSSTVWFGVQPPGAPHEGGIVSKHQTGVATFVRKTLILLSLSPLNHSIACWARDVAWALFLENVAFLIELVTKETIATITSALMATATTSSNKDWPLLKIFFCIYLFYIN
jgi:hypothetical protein